MCHGRGSSAVASCFFGLLVRVQSSTCAPIGSTMPIVRPTCPACVGSMTPGSEAVNMVCPDCGTALAEGSLTVRWAISKKLFWSKRTRLTLRTRSPELLFILKPNIVPFIGEERGGSALLSSCNAAVSVKLLECSAALPFLHLMSVSAGDGGSTEYRGRPQLRSEL